MSLHSTNLALYHVLSAQTPLQTPQRNYVNRLGKTAERLQAQNTILQRENQELRATLSARSQYKTGATITLKGEIVLSTEEVFKARDAIEKARKERYDKKGSRKRKASESINQLASADVRGEEEEDCIVVESRDLSLVMFERK